MKKNKADMEKTKLAILESAKMVFAHKEYSAATLEEIAEKAGLTRGALYWHFKNKEELIGFLLDEYETQLCLKAKQVLESTQNQSLSLSKKCTLWLSLWIYGILNELPLFKIRILYSLQYPHKISEIRKKANADLMNMTNNFFLNSAHEIRHPLKEKALNFIIMTLDTSIAYKLIIENINNLQPNEPDPEFLLNEYHRLFLNYLNLKEE